MTTYPYGYSTARRTITGLHAALDPHYHPEYIRRLFAWLEDRGGIIGIGGHWRAGGAQPDKPGFAPEGRSFHQDQEYADGFVGACAVDLVKTNPDGGAHIGVTWADVLPQDSAEAAAWGLHCNVGAPGVPGSEPWHMQPIEIDGWLRWWNNGRPAPAPNYPLPTDHTEDDMARKTVVIARFAGTANQWEIASVANLDAKKVHGYDAAPVIVLPTLTAEQQGAIEAQLGYKLTPHTEQ